MSVQSRLASSADVGLCMDCAKLWDEINGERAVLEQLLGGEPVDRDTITEKTGYQRSTRDAYLQRLRARELVVDLSRGMVMASPTLFEVA